MTTDDGGQVVARNHRNHRMTAVRSGCRVDNGAGRGE